MSAINKVIIFCSLTIYFIQVSTNDNRFHSEVPYYLNRLHYVALMKLTTEWSMASYASIYANIKTGSLERKKVLQRN